jgi:hypothetical protein
MTYCSACQCNHQSAGSPTIAPPAACNNTSLTSDHLHALEAAIAAGALKVRYRDEEVTYGSFEDLERRYKFVKAIVCPNSANRLGGAPAFVRKKVAYSSGLGCGGFGNRWF